MRQEYSGHVGYGCFELTACGCAHALTYHARVSSVMTTTNPGWEGINVMTSNRVGMNIRGDICVDAGWSVLAVRKHTYAEEECTMSGTAPCQGRLDVEHTASQRLNWSAPGLIGRSN